MQIIEKVPKLGSLTLMCTFHPKGANVTLCMINVIKAAVEFALAWISDDRSIYTSSHIEVVLSDFSMFKTV